MEARKAYLRAGGSVDRFWGLTPHETFLEIDASSEREIALYRQAAYGAWHAVAFDRQKRLPRLSDVINRISSGGARKPRRKRSREENLLILETLNRSFGGTDLRTPPPKPET